MKPIKIAKVQGYDLALIQDTSPVYGGSYSVYINYEGVAIKKEGLCLDAAHDLFNSYLRGVLSIQEQFNAVTQ